MKIESLRSPFIDDDGVLGIGLNARVRGQGAHLLRRQPVKRGLARAAGLREDLVTISVQHSAISQARRQFRLTASR